MRMTTLMLIALVALAPADRAAPAEPASGASGLEWLAGTWIGETERGFSEEVWSTPEGGSMMGMWRLVIDGMPQLYEFFDVAQEADDLVLRLRHFDADGTSWEPRDTPLRLRLVDHGPQHARFESSAATAPNLRISYARDGNRLVSTVDHDGEKQSFVFELEGS